MRDGTRIGPGHATARVALAAAVLVGGFAIAARPASATGNSLRVEPGSATVPEDGTVSVRIVENAEVPVSGVAATLTFDPTLLQVQSVARGTPFAEAPVFTGAGPAAITTANTTGSLTAVAAAFLPPDSVPAGDADFLVVTFKAIGCGQASLGLPTGPVDAALLDGRAATYGEPLPVSTAGGSVAICNSLRVEPASATVPEDGTVSVRIVENAEVPVSGVAATLTFDPTLLQVQSVARGTPFAEAPVFTGAGPAAITTANTTGSLTAVAAAFLPPDSVPAGDADFLVVTFKAIGCGQASLGLPTGPVDAALLDGRAATYGEPLPVSTAGGTLTTCVEATATPTPTITPGPTATPTATPVPTTTPRPSVTAPPLPAGNSVRIEPYYTGVVAGGGFTIRVVGRSTVALSGASASLTFDKAVLQVVSITKATPFAGAPIFAGAGPSQIAAANASGRLAGVAAAFLPPGNVPAGDAEFLLIELKAIACGETQLAMPIGPSDGGMIDGRTSTYGNTLTVASVGAIVQACDPQATPTPRPTPTPTATPIPTPAPVPTPVPYVPPPVPPGSTDGGIVVPPPEALGPSPEPVPLPASAAPAQAAIAVAAPSPTPDGPPAAVRNAALVGVGVAGMMAALAVVLTLAFATVAAVAVPLLVVRARTRGR